MAKITDARLATLQAYFNASDVITEANMADLALAIQEAAQDHQHLAGGGSGSGTGDGGFVSNVQSGLDASKSATPAVGDVYITTDTTTVYACHTANNWTAILGGITKAALNVDDATVPDFQATPAGGTMGYDDNVNDNDPDSYAFADTIGEYAVVEFGKMVAIRRFRHYGDNSQNEDGEWKIQYLDIYGNWEDWVTGIATRASETWSDWDSSGGERICTEVKLVAVILDTGGYFDSHIGELEVIY